MSTENQLAILPPAALARQVDHATWNALSEIYGDPSPEKLGLVLDYCKARKMDPLKKPVHIVPVWSKKRGVMVETIWPAISEVRATAMRTGVYAGREATVFGPTIKRNVGNVSMEFPEWAQVTVYRIVAGHRCAFIGPVCDWLECYSRAGKDPAPNSMWAKRPKGQLDKCAEAASLRAAFPEETGGQATAEEMEGKELYDAEEVTEHGATTVTAEDRPKVERKRRGAAAAMETETTAQPAGPISESPQPGAQSTGPEGTATGGTRNAAPVIEAEFTPAEAPAPITRTSLADKETLIATCEVAEWVAKDFNPPNAPKPNLAVRAVLKGEYAGVVYDTSGVTKQADGTIACNPLWSATGPRKFTLLGKARVDGTAAVVVTAIGGAA